MMNHLIRLLVKFILTAIILEIVLNITTAVGFGNILLISLTVTILGYILGDVLILRVSNNIIATICDLVLVTLTIYLFSFLPVFTSISFGDALIAGIVTAASEWFFHRFMLREKA